MNALPYEFNWLSYVGVLLAMPAFVLAKTFVYETGVLEMYRAKKAADRMAGPFARFIKQDGIKPLESLAEFRTVSLVLGFLSLAGLDLALNVGIAGLLLRVFGLAYLYMNLGFLFRLVGSTKRGFAFASAILLGTSALVGLSQVLLFARLWL